MIVILKTILILNKLFYFQAMTNTILSPTIKNVSIVHLDWLHRYPKHFKEPCSPSVCRLRIVVSVELEDGVVIAGHQAVILRGDISGHYTSIILRSYSSKGTVNISPGLGSQASSISEFQALSRTVNVLQLPIFIQNICNDLMIFLCSL